MLYKIIFKNTQGNHLTINVPEEIARNKDMGAMKDKKKNYWYIDSEEILAIVPFEPEK